MEFNGQDDYFARWFQAACALPLLAFGFVCLWFLIQNPFLGVLFIVRDGLGIGAFYLAYRCLRYAVTGKRNINRDDF